MRKLVYILILPLLFGACSTKSKKEKQQSKPVVTVTILPQKYFVEQIAGEFLDVNVMVLPGASPADYEPSPKQITKLANSEFYFYVGHLGFEKSWISKLAEAAPNVKFVPTSVGIDLLYAEHSHNSDDTDEHHVQGTDPHVWTSPENVKTMSKNIYQSLVKSFPEQQEVFTENLNLFISRIDSLDIELRNKLNEVPNRTFLIYHPALGYFARDYHLEQVSIEYEGKSPSTAHIKDIVDLAKVQNISVIFIQSQFETNKAKSIAKEINAKIVAIDPLSPNWMKEMKQIGEHLTKALSN